MAAYSRLLRLVRYFLLFSLLCGSSVSHAQPAKLSWEVSNPFPLLGEDAFNGVRRTWEIEKKRLSRPPTMHELILARMDKKKNTFLKRAFLIADPLPLRDHARESISARDPVRVRLAVSGLAQCIWSVSPQPAEQPEDGICKTSMLVNRNVPYQLAVRDPTGVAASTTVFVKDFYIVAMGDSYSSGQGAPDRPAIYSEKFNEKLLNNNDWFLRGPSPKAAVWFDELCHRSLLSWQVLSALKLALEHPDVVVRLLHTACSGAEFYDGIFNAQQKSGIEGAGLENRNLMSQLSEFRDGEGKRSPPTPPALYMNDSQINAVRRASCPWHATYEDVSVPGYEFKATRMSCPTPLPFMRPHALLLTAGGNDVGFTSAVGGLVLPEKARSPLGQPFLTGARRFLRTISPEQLTENVGKLQSVYATLIEKAAEGALATTANTVLVMYPNPIGSDATTGDKCYQAGIQNRLKNANLGLSVAVKNSIPLFGNFLIFPVEFAPHEIDGFMTQAYPALKMMMKKSSAKSVAWLEAAGSADGFEKRLLCTDQARYLECEKHKEQVAQEPTYFCQKTDGEFKDNCRTKDLSTWNSEGRQRRLVNMANDAILAQRTYQGVPTQGQLYAALAGMFHPTAEAYSIAADSAHTALCRVLQGHGVCESGNARVEELDAKRIGNLEWLD
jgi:hypothetical protein